MTTWEGNDAKQTTPGRQRRIWRGITRGAMLALAGVGAVSGGLALNWDWLTAVGAAPILLGILPCATMCAFGLCMRGGSEPRHRAAGSKPPAAGTDPLASPVDLAGANRKETA